MPIFREKYQYECNTIVDKKDQWLSRILVDVFAEEKTERKKLANTAHENLAKDRDLLKFEQAYLKQCTSWSDLRRKLQEPNNRKYLLVKDDPQQNGVHYLHSVETQKKLGTVFVGDRRFEPTSLATNTRQRTFVRRGHSTNKQYVLTKSGHYAPRYVTRGLNQLDSSRLCGHRGLIPSQASSSSARINDTNSFYKEGQRQSRRHPVPTHTRLTENEQILSHTRGWWKRFISTTATKRSVLSTQGKEFRGMFGAVTIDLAEIDPNEILDLHTPNAASNVFGFAVDQILQLQSITPASSHSDEKLRAMRDVIRTREILIKSVPFAAVKFHSYTENILGFCWNENPANKYSFKQGNKRIVLDETVERRVLDRISNRSYRAYDLHREREVLPYLWDQQYWDFYRFATSEDCARAYELLRSDPATEGIVDFFVFRSYTPAQNVL